MTRHGTARFLSRLAVPPCLLPGFTPRTGKFTRPAPCLPRHPRLELAPTAGDNSPVMAPGEVAEWSNAPHSKCGIGASLSGVRIPPSPPPPRSLNKCGVLSGSLRQTIWPRPPRFRPAAQIRNMEVVTFWPALNGPGTLVADGVRLLRKAAIALAVISRELRKSVPRHDRRQDAAVRPFTGLHRLHDLLRGPTTDAGLFVGCDVWAHEDTLHRNLEAHIRAAEKARHVGIAEEVSRRVAVVAAADVTRYLPRAICESSAMAANAASAIIDAVTNARRTEIRNMICLLLELRCACSTPALRPMACGRSRRRSRRVRRTRPSRCAGTRLPRATPSIRPACSFALPSRSAC